MHLNDFRLERFQGLAIQVELHPQRPVGNPSPAPEQLDHLVNHCKEVHHRPSTCANAASVCGSQKVISMARYSSMAVINSVRARF